MLAWESAGRPFPEMCSEPELLADIVQGKTNRDFCITEWRRDVADGYFTWREFIGVYGLTEAECRKIFDGLALSPTGRELWQVRWSVYMGLSVNGKPEDSKPSTGGSIPPRPAILTEAEQWLLCVDEYDRKTGRLIRERQDPQTRLIRGLLRLIERQ